MLILRSKLGRRSSIHLPVIVTEYHVLAQSTAFCPTITGIEYLVLPFVAAILLLLHETNPRKLFWVLLVEEIEI